MPPENETTWQRLGRLLAGRREQIAPRYKNKNLFAEERGLHRRMVWSVESGERGTYSDKTLRLIESAYALAVGSIGRTVAGGELEPADEAPRPGRAAAADDADDADEPQGDEAWILFPADPSKRHVWRTPGMPQDDRLELIALIDRKRAEVAGGDVPRRQANAS